MWTVCNGMHFQGQPTHEYSSNGNKSLYLLTTSLQRNKLIHEGYDYLDRLKRG